MPPAPESGYAPVNGVELYWESYGSGGTPLVMVHGGYGLIRTWGSLVDHLARRRRVIAVELQGHGHTRDTGRTFSWEAFGDDVAGVVRHLGFGQADLFGYSLGATSSLRAAIRHPELIRRLALLSIPFCRDGWHPEIRAAFDQMSDALFDQMKQSRVYSEWAAVAPDAGAFPALMKKMGELLRLPYDWSGDVGKLRMPVLLIYADADGIATDHIARFYGLLGGGLNDAGWDGSRRSAAQLAIIPATTHYNVVSSPMLRAVLDDFLG